MMGWMLIQHIADCFAKVRINKGLSPRKIKEVAAESCCLINTTVQLFLIQGVGFGRRGSEQTVATGKITGIGQVKPDFFQPA